MKRETRDIFDRICREENATYIKGLTNPIKNMGKTSILYALQCGTVHECILNTADLKKVALNCTWVVNNSPKSRRPRLITNKYGRRLQITHALFKVPKGYVVDHINRDTLDNRRCNLRVVTPGVNMLNKDHYPSTLSGTGVPNIHKKGDKYRLTYSRQFNNLDIAIQAKEAIQGLIDHYSHLDATNRLTP